VTDHYDIVIVGTGAGGGTLANVLAPLESGFARAIRDESWQSYQHEYGSAGGTEVSVDLDSDLMRLATGGSAG
jgi:hypothetical protein